MRCEGSGDKPRFKDSTDQGKCDVCGSIVPLTSKGKLRVHDVADSAEYVGARRVYLSRSGDVTTDGRDARRLLTKVGRRVSAEDVDRYGLLDHGAVRVAGSKQAPKGANKQASKGEDK